VSFRLEGKVALVTGAGRGIGRACALALADAGADVVAVSRTATDLNDLAREVRDRGRRVDAVVCDVTESDRVRAVIAELPRPDVLVASAGANVPEPLLEVSDERLDGLLKLNVRAVFVTIQAAARRMVEGGSGGSIVAISSQMGHVGAADRRSVYCTTKHAVEGLVKAAALELAPHAVRVNAVAPTFVETAMTAPFLADAAFRAGVEQRIPLGRVGRPEDVTGAVLYLASEAAALVTGTSLLVDGGWTAQ
jgi:NAD(P)-dependent dehydrogenase (short-subunit alcohol dehydrogenase family)